MKETQDIPIIQFIQKYPVPAIIFFGLATLLPGLGIFPVSIMEARNFIVAREMLFDSNWIFTTMNGEIRYEKPPFPSWTLAVTGLLFGGVDTVVFRIPAIAMAIIVLINFYLFSQKIKKDLLFPVLSTLVLASSFYFIAIVKEAPSDIFAHGAMLISVFFLFKSLSSNQMFDIQFLLAGVFGGISILSKGPVSIFALFLPFILAYFLTFGKKSFSYQWLKILLLLLLMLIVGGWWYAATALFDPDNFNVVASQETGNWVSYNIRPFYYYWNFFLQSGIWAIPAVLGLIFPLIKKAKLEQADLFPILWILFTVLLLSFIPEKKPRYLFPVLFPMAWATSSYLLRLFKENKNLHTLEWIILRFNFGIIALASFLIPVVGWVLYSSHIYSMLWSYLIFSTFLIAIGISIIYSLLKKDFLYPVILTMLFQASIIIYSPVAFQVTKTNPNYSELSGFDHEKYKKPLRFSYIQPEFVWNYGDKIQPISSEIKIQNNKEEISVLVHSSHQDSMIKELSGLFNISIEDEFDLNISSKPGEKGYRTRKTLCHYLLSPK